jgi:hypothetical protein
VGVPREGGVPGEILTNVSSSFPEKAVFQERYSPMFPKKAEEVVFQERFSPVFP